MQTVCRVRMKVPDRPGALAQLTAIIARHGGNVVGMDIHELDGVNAVDDLIIDAPEGWDAGSLAGELEATGVQLVSVLPGVGWRDPVVRSLEWAAAMASAAPQDSELELSRTVGEVTNASGAWVCRPAEAAAYGSGQLAIHRGGSVVAEVDGREPGVVPEGLHGVVADHICVLAAPDDELVPTLVAFAIRPVSEPFTTSEVARLTALLKLFRALRPAVVS